MPEMGHSPLSWFRWYWAYPVFTQAEILSFNDALTVDTIQNWANRNLINHIKGPTGRRLYNIVEVVRICLAPTLMRECGVGPQKALQMVMDILLAMDLDGLHTISASRAKNLLAVFGPLDGHKDVEVFDSNIRRDFFRNSTSASIVVPFGRMFVDVVTKAVKLRGAEQAKHVKAIKLGQKPSTSSDDEVDSEQDTVPKDEEQSRLLERMFKDIRLLEAAAAKNRNPATAGPPFEKPWIRR
jgi:hypothetical protein